MNDAKPHLELTGLERFAHLEDKIFRVVEAFKAVRKENESLRAENQKLLDQLKALQENESTVNENLAHLQQEREELKERVERALNLLSTIEAR
jgi:FtsZ-binding cell division protein ZapB